MKTMLITGGAGFIGSNFIAYMQKQHPDIFIVNLDVLTYAGNLQNLSGISDQEGYAFIHGSIDDQALVSRIFSKYKICCVVNFAAETHVDRSIEGPEPFLKTNILGTANLLKCALNFWKKNPANKYSRDYKEGVRFIQISTDEVYGTLEKDAPPFKETNNLLPNSPYSASKASADLLTRAYFETYGLPINITRCSNNFGPFQFPEKLIPLVINNAAHDREIPLYGDGGQVRDWVYVEDHCRGIDAVFWKGIPGEIYNIGGESEHTNLQVVEEILRLLNKPHTLIRYVADRPGHDRRYAINNHKITKELGFSPMYTFEERLKETVLWYQRHENWVQQATNGSYMQYYKEMYPSFS